MKHHLEMPACLSCPAAGPRVPPHPRTTPHYPAFTLGSLARRRGRKQLSFPAWGWHSLRAVDTSPPGNSHFPLAIPPALPCSRGMLSPGWPSANPPGTGPRVIRTVQGSPNCSSLLGWRCSTSPSSSPSSPLHTFSARHSPSPAASATDTSPLLM